MSGPCWTPPIPSSTTCWEGGEATCDEEPVTTPCPECSIYPAPAPLPTPLKSMSIQALHSQVLGTPSTNSRDILVQLKNAMIATGIWTCNYSCDGFAIGAPGDHIDRWASYLNVVGSGGGGFSFIVLDNVKTGTQLCFQCTVSGIATGGGWSEINVWWAPSGGFTGGTIGGTAPSAPNRIQGNIGQWLGTGPAPPPNENPQFHVGYWQSSDGECTRIVGIFKGKLISFMQFDKLQHSPSGWTTPSVVHYMQAGNDYTAPTNRYTIALYGKVIGSGGMFKRSVLPSGTQIDWEADSSAIQAGGLNYDVAVVPHANEWSTPAQWPWVAPSAFLSQGRAAGLNGIGGWIADQWFVPLVFNDSDTADGHKWIFFGNMLLQWNGADPGFAAAAPVDYAKGLFYGRSTA